MRAERGEHPHDEEGHLIPRPLLSVLLPTIWSRRYLFSTLYHKLEIMAQGEPVELLSLLDNRAMTIGAKCNALIAMARGEYLTFVDDDDDVEADYLNDILGQLEETPGTDVVSYLVHCRLESASGAVVENVVHPSVLHPNEEFHPGPAPVLRKPLQTSVWRSELAKSSQWADAQYEADAAWASRLWPQVKSERVIQRVLYRYRWSAARTEAR